MKPAKYRKFVTNRPWFPSAARPLIDWRDYGLGKTDPDQATEAFFLDRVSHLGIVPPEQFNFEREGTEHEDGLWCSELLLVPLKIEVIRTHRVVYHHKGEERFTQNHPMVLGGTVKSSIEGYGGSIDSGIDAIIEHVCIAFSNMKTHRFNVIMFPGAN